MNIKAAYHYEISDYIKSILIYYIIILAFDLFLVLGTGFSSISTSTTTDSSGNVITETVSHTANMSHSEFSGMEFVTVIFIFVIGYCAFRNTFGFLIQNSFSRKTILVGQCLTSLTFVLIMTTINELLLIILKTLVSMFFSNTEWTSLYEDIYVASPVGIGSIPFHIANYFYSFFLFLFAMTAGYLVSLIYYRINRIVKIILNVTLLVSVILLPSAINDITDGKFYSISNRFFDIILGITANHPINAIISFTVLSILITYLSWLLIRRAIVKV